MLLLVEQEKLAGIPMNHQKSISMTDEFLVRVVPVHQLTLLASKNVYFIGVNIVLKAIKYVDFFCKSFRLWQIFFDKHVNVTNFSSSWADGMAFCALVHHYLPTSINYDALNPKDRRKNFEIAFKAAE